MSTSDDFLIPQSKRFLLGLESEVNLRAKEIVQQHYDSPKHFRKVEKDCRRALSEMIVYPEVSRDFRVSMTLLGCEGNIFSRKYYLEPIIRDIIFDLAENEFIEDAYKVVNRLRRLADKCEKTVKKIEKTNSERPGPRMGGSFLAGAQASQEPQNANPRHFVRSGGSFIAGKEASEQLAASAIQSLKDLDELHSDKADDNG